MIKTVLPCLLLLLALPSVVLAWGVDGHRIVGEYALQWLDEPTQGKLRTILGETTPETLETACNWPDTVRETAPWEWSAPLHYVNIPRKAGNYQRDRDCPDGLCVTEAIVDYAQKLQSARLSTQEQWQAVAWLCHLVGDLHQPLHAGFRDDRGANYVHIEYRGKGSDLHHFWDTALPRSHLGKDNSWQPPLDVSGWQNPPGAWLVSDVERWTDQSHALVHSAAYPPTGVIDEDFAEASWHTVRQQWQHAGYRLAMILNAALGEGEVLLQRE